MARRRGMLPEEKKAAEAAQAKANLERIVRNKKYAAYRAAQIKAAAEKRAAKRQAIKKAADKKLIGSWKASAAAKAALVADTGRRLAEHKRLQNIRNAEARKLALARQKERDARAAANKAALKAALSTKKTTTTSSRRYERTTIKKGGSSGSTGKKHTSGGY
jgi:colicin import membrane protein